MLKNPSNSKTNPWQIVAGLVVVAVMTFGIVWLIVFMFNNVDAAVIAAIITTSGTIIISVVAITVGQNKRAKKEIELKIREQKLEIYSYVVYTLIGLIYSYSENKNPDDDIEKLRDLHTKLLLWGDFSVIQIYNFLKSTKDKDSSLSSVLGLETFILEIRKQLGYNDVDFKKGDILRLILNDYDEAIGKIK